MTDLHCPAHAVYTPTCAQCRVLVLTRERDEAVANLRAENERAERWRKAAEQQAERARVAEGYNPHSAAGLELLAESERRGELLREAQGYLPLSAEALSHRIDAALSPAGESRDARLAAAGFEPVPDHAKDPFVRPLQLDAPMPRPPAPAPAAEACGRCGGAGEVEEDLYMPARRGLVQCPDCAGTGKRGTP
jgi:hypothetical protein